MSNGVRQYFKVIYWRKAEEMTWLMNCVTVMVHLKLCSSKTAVFCSLVQLLVLSLVHSLTYSLTYSLAHSLFHSLAHNLLHWFIHVACNSTYYTGEVLLLLPEGDKRLYENIASCWQQKINNEIFQLFLNYEHVLIPCNHIIPSNLVRWQKQQL